MPSGGGYRASISARRRSSASSFSRVFSSTCACRSNSARGTRSSRGCLADRSQFYRDLAGGPFFGANQPGARVSQGAIDSFWLQAMRAGHHNAFEGIRAFSETDFTADLKRIDVPTLIVHGDADQIVPIGAAGLRTVALVKGSVLRIYSGAPHGLPVTHREQLTADLLAFLKT